MVPGERELGVSAWPEPLSAIRAGQPAGAHFGAEAFAAGGTIEPQTPRLARTMEAAGHMAVGFAVRIRRAMRSVTSVPLSRASLLIQCGPVGKSQSIVPGPGSSSQFSLTVAQR